MPLVNEFPDLDKPFTFTLVRKSFGEFLEAYVDLSQSSDAPTPPWVIFTQLPSLQQKSEMQRLKTEQHSDGHQDKKRRPRVVFDDEATGNNGRAAAGAQQNAAGGAQANDNNSAHRQAVVKKMKAAMDTLHIQSTVDLCSPEVIREYFAAKSLIEHLPMQSVIPNPPQGLLATPAFLSRAKEIVDHLAAVGAHQHATHSARFKRLALRRAGGSGGAEGAVLGHHYGARHAFQMFLRSLLTEDVGAAVVREPLVGSSVPTKDGSSIRTRQQQAYAQQQQIQTAATREVQSVKYLPKSSLTATASSPTGLEGNSKSRETILAAVEQSTGLPSRTITALHLQSHGFQKDSRYFNKHSDGSSVDGGSNGGLKRGVSVGQLSANSSQRDMSRPLSQQSSGAFESENSDTRSVHSSGTSAASGGGSQASNSLANTPYVCPPWQLTTQEFWIALKGVVFSINANHKKTTSSIPLGRFLYYRLVLLPVFSGRDCTRSLAWIQLSCSTMDYLGVEDYVAAWRQKLVIAAGNADNSASNSSQGASSKPMSGPAKYWPQPIREHVNRIFDMFTADFEVIGELEGSEDLWF